MRCFTAAPAPSTATGYSARRIRSARVELGRAAPTRAGRQRATASASSVDGRSATLVRCRSSLHWRWAGVQLDGRALLAAAARLSGNRQSGRAQQPARSLLRQSRGTGRSRVLTRLQYLQEHPCEGARPGRCALLGALTWPRALCRGHSAPLLLGPTRLPGRDDHDRTRRREYGSRSGQLSAAVHVPVVLRREDAARQCRRRSRHVLGCYPDSRSARWRRTA